MDIKIPAFLFVYRHVSQNHVFKTKTLQIQMKHKGII